MRNNPVGKPRFWAWNRQVIDLFFSSRLDIDDAIPKDVIGASGS
jgi:hypothetical protein